MVGIQNLSILKYDLLVALYKVPTLKIQEIKIWINAYIKDKMRVYMVGESPCIYNIS